MREALGISLEESPDYAIDRYYVLYKLLNQAELKTIELTKEQKSRNRLHKRISKNISKLKSLTEDKNNKRLTEKKFDKQYSKYLKKLSRDFEINKDIKDYELLASLILEIDKHRDTKNSILLITLF